ncbi:type VI secretion system-associated protein TagO [Marinobacter alexandrii]|uniref:type VI secretion system-associated protein TagO n=1 Tax=Marinobacter alexandrii TaxID=2570351 RepID=UPI0014861B44|nr:type VI secretion system-associated protein TagO [Marinobacter alexandrii]
MKSMIPAKTTFSFILASIISATAIAKGGGGQDCAGIANDAKRLGCYDLAAGKAVKTTGAPGNWQLTEEKNPLDDTKTLVLSLVAESGSNRRGQKPVLFIRCRSNKTEMWISWEDFLGSDNPKVTTRIGGSEAKTRAWDVSSTKTSSFYPRSPVLALQRIMKADQFVAQVTPYNENPITAIFQISGLDSAIKPLRKNCNW